MTKMDRRAGIMYVVLFCIGFLFISVLGGCSAKSNDISKTEITELNNATEETDVANVNKAKKTDVTNMTQKADLATVTKNTDIIDSTKVNLPAIEVIPKNKITPSQGVSLAKVKAMVVQYLKGQDVNGDIQSNISIDEITIKEAWENLQVQLYKVKLEYACIYGIAVVKDEKVVSMISGMPVFEVFIADLDMDSKYEVYANTSFGSGIVSDDVSGYNIATNTKYYLSERMGKDFKLFIKDNTLLVKEYPYGYLSRDLATSHQIKALKIQKGKLVLGNSGLDYRFAVYKVKGESIKKAVPFGSEEINNGKKINLSEFEVENTPLFTDKDIEKYNWNTNTITFNADFLKEHKLSQEDIKQITEENKTLESGRMLSFYDGSRLLGCPGTAAVIITVGEDRLYSSGFVLPAWSSSLPPDITIGDSATNSIRIYSISELEKIIHDKRIYDCFKKLGKLEE